MQKDLVETRLNGSSETFNLVEKLRAAFPQAYVVGGYVRDSLALVARPSKDIDLACTNEEFSRARKIGVAGFDVTTNSYGNLKLRRHGMSVDLFAPETFYHGFPDVASMLCFFDVSINAVAWPLMGGPILDPLGGAAQISKKEFSLVTGRWNSTYDSESRAVLLSRLLKLWRYFPSFACTNSDLLEFDIEDDMNSQPRVVDHHVRAAPCEAAQELRNFLARNQ